MSSSDSSRSNRPQLEDQIQQFSIGQFRSMGLVHMLGYGLLLLLFVDSITILFPPQFTDPVWELETIGKFIERVPILFLGLALVFFGEDNPRGRYEGPVVNFLSWFALILAILFYVMVPLGIFNAIKIDQQNEETVNLRFSQQTAQIQQVRTQVDQANSLEQLNRLRSSLRIIGISPSQSEDSLSENRQQLMERLKNYDQEALLTRNNEMNRQHRRLLKLSFKWNLGAIISGTALLLTWRNTRWAR